MPGVTRRDSSELNWLKTGDEIQTRSSTNKIIKAKEERLWY